MYGRELSQVLTCVCVGINVLKVQVCILDVTFGSWNLACTLSITYVSLVCLFMERNKDVPYNLYLYNINCIMWDLSLGFASLF